MRKRPAALRGFTLIELLLVIGIMAVLAGIIFLALNPNRQLGSARDRKRHNDITSILNAVYQYQIDYNQLPPGIPTVSTRQICKTGAASCVNGVNFTSLTQSGIYLVGIPEDPHTPASGTGTSYWIVRDANHRITVTAPLAEEVASGTLLNVTR